METLYDFLFAGMCALLVMLAIKANKEAIKDDSKEEKKDRDTNVDWS